MQQISQFTFLAYQYGPFFFGVFFLLIQSLNALYAFRREPSRSSRSKTYKQIFWYSNAIGTVFAIAGAVWWFTNPPIKHSFFTGKIINVSGVATIDSTDVHLRKTELTGPKASPSKLASPNESELKVRQYSFLAISYKGFSETTNFTIYYWVGEKESFSLHLWYTPEKDITFIIDRDPETNKPVLKRLRKREYTNKQQPITLFSPAYADNNSEDGNIIVSSRKSPILRPNLPQVKNPGLATVRIHNYDFVSELQEERTSVKRKLQLIREMEKLEINEFEAIMRTSSKKEPMVLTILDLTRHTDPLVSYFSTKVIQKFSLAIYIEELFRSLEPANRSIANEILFRISDRARKRILDASEIDRKLLADVTPRVLIPTGSRNGDRYYVKATWDDRVDFDCLARLFNKQLLHDNRSLDTEKIMMQKMKGRRFVYWYSKTWALFMAREIEKCRANSDFVNGITFAQLQNTKW